MRFREKSRCTLVLFATLLVGCGEVNGLAPVRGRVLVDGQPFDGAAVMFHPAGGGVPATGVTGSNGDFEMVTAQAKGATLGQNAVSVVKQVNASPNRKVEEGEIVPMKFLTPPKYASPQTSGLSVDVKRGMEPIELQLKSK